MRRTQKRSSSTTAAPPDLAWAIRHWRPGRQRRVMFSSNPMSTRDPLIHVAGAIEARAFRQRIAQLFDEIDVLLCPVSSITAPPQVDDGTIIEVFGNDHRNIIRLTRLTSFWDLAGTPAISLPWGFDGEGLPLAVQLVTAIGTDEALLSLAARLEVEAPDRGRRPPLD